MGTRGNWMYALSIFIVFLAKLLNQQQTSSWKKNSVLMEFVHFQSNTDSKVIKVSKYKLKPNTEKTKPTLQWAAVIVSRQWDTRQADIFEFPSSSCKWCSTLIIWLFITIRFYKHETTLLPRSAKKNKLDSYRSCSHLALTYVLGDPIISGQC